MLKTVLGHSDDPDSQDAIEEVLEQCTRELAGMLPKAGLLFAAIDFDHALILQKINQVFQSGRRPCLLRQTGRVSRGIR